MNLHLPQTEEAKAEAMELMGVSSRQTDRQTDRYTDTQTDRLAD